MRHALVWLLILGCGRATQPTDASSADTDPLPVCPVDACESGCTDLDVDPDNCGACGTTCVIDNARPECVAGTCELGTCEEGWADCDGRMDNGCEAEAHCIDGSACATTCGSLGALDCTDACAPVCEPPAETCNLADDDCDGTCDEDLPDCRQGVYRAEGSLGYLYGLDPDEAERLGQTIDFGRYFDVLTAQAPGTEPLYRCDKGGGRRFLTTSMDCEGLAEAPELTLGFVATEPACESTPLFRLRDPDTGGHFYTLSPSARDRAIEAGSQSEGSVGEVWRPPR